MFPLNPSYKIDGLFFNVRIITNISTMSKKSNCLFCNSVRHDTTKCNSNMKGKLNMLLDCMKKPECPDFGSFTLQELKVVAYLTPYEKSLLSNTMGSNKLNRKYGRTPIPLTLSKTRMVKALCERWKSLHIVRENYSKKPTVMDEIDDCPICFEQIQECRWSWTHSVWSRGYSVNTVRTKCNHYYCGSCWDNIKPQHYHGSMKSCPLCRTQNSLEDIRIKG